MTAQFCLASRSPRRRELLDQLGYRYTTLAADLPEIRQRGQTPADYAIATALAKARHAASQQALPALGADTDVVVDDDILGKPADAADAAAMLGRLSGRAHAVYSAVALVHEHYEATALVVTQVEFARISDAEAAAYWATGEPRDKAGGYAVQGHAARWIRAIRGSYSAVVGLPLFETAELLRSLNIVPQWLMPQPEALS